MDRSWPVAMRRFPTLTVATPRVQVRPLVADDAREAGAVLADPATRRWLPFAPEDAEIDGLAWCTDAAVERRDSGIGDHYAVVRREDDQLVGCVWTGRTDWMALSTEVSYAVRPDTRGFGLAPEAVDAVAVALLLEHGFQRIEIRVAPGNMASRRVAEKAGFTYEGLLRNADVVHGGRVDMQVWSLVAADLR
jgi:ribosomal-protein-alanine N-acetyltransferase